MGYFFWNRYLVSASEDKTLRIWDLNNQILEKTIDFNSEKIRDYNGSLTINISPDGKYFIIDGKVFDKQRNPINPIYFKKNLDGQYLIGSNGIVFWDLEYFQNKEYKDNDDSSSSSVIAVSSDRQYFVHKNKTMIEIKNNQGEKVGKLNRVSKVTVATFTHDGNRILVGYDNGEILLLDKQGKILKSFKEHQKAIEIINLSSDDQFFVSSATDEKTGRLWSLNDDRVKIEFQGHNEVVRTIVFSPDGQYIATGSGRNKRASTSERPYVSKENTIRLWDLQGNQIGKSFEGNNAETSDIFGRSSPVTSIAFTPDSQSMISASENSYEVFVWRAFCSLQPIAISSRF
jgi:WD40 repeat protein